MRSMTIELSDLCLRELAGLMQLSGQWLLPQASGEPKKLIQARKELEQADLAHQDLDGSMMPEPLLGRMIYNFRKARSAVRLSAGVQTEIYVCGPVDALWLSREAEEPWQIALRPFSDMTEALWDAASSAEHGSLCIVHDGNEMPMEEALPDGAEVRETWLREKIRSVFVGEEGIQNA